MTIMTERRSFFQGAELLATAATTALAASPAFAQRLSVAGLDWICDESPACWELPSDKGNTRMRRRISSLVQSRPARTAAQPELGSRIPLVSLIQALSVAEHLNFRHAASALGVSQSSVSTRIKQLEQDLSIALFERRHRGVRLTEAGQHFLEHVATGIEHLDHAVRTAGAIARGEQGRLCVGLYSSIAAGFLAELLR